MKKTFKYEVIAERVNGLRVTLSRHGKAEAAVKALKQYYKRYDAIINDAKAQLRYKESMFELLTCIAPKMCAGDSKKYIEATLEDYKSFLLHMRVVYVV